LLGVLPFSENRRWLSDNGLRCGLHYCEGKVGQIGNLGGRDRELEVDVTLINDLETKDSGVIGDAVVNICILALS
jgi:hypothetical protein